MKTVIVDGHALLFQMFFGMPNKIKNHNGENIEAVVGFVGALLKIVGISQPTHLLVVFDAEQPLLRKEIDASYKSNRIDYSQVAANDNPFTQLPHIMRCLGAMGVAFYEAVGCEADDVIAGLCKQNQAHGEVVIVSPDKDFLQLVCPKVSVLAYRGKLSKWWTENAVKEQFGVSPSQWVLYRAMTGDASDNIKGLQGIGPKTAAKLLASFGSLDALLAQFDKEKQQKLLQNIAIMDLGACQIPQIDLAQCKYLPNGLKTVDVLKKVGLRQ